MTKIHYFLDGNIINPYLNNWKEKCPNYEIIHWHSGNLPISDYPFLSKIIEHKKWSILSDFIRHWAVYTFGGYYLDIDVELIKPLDSLHKYPSFVCIEGYPIAANAAVSGGKIGAWLQKKCLDRLCEINYDDLLSGKIDAIPELYVSPQLVTNVIELYNGRELDAGDLNEIKEYSRFATLPKQYFYPFNYNEIYTAECIKPETIGVHWWHKSWG